MATDMASITQKAQSLTLKSFAPRPGFGKLGRPLRTKANVYPARLTGGTPPLVHQYDVDIRCSSVSSGRSPSKALIKAAWTAFEKMAPADIAPALAFDGRKILYTATRLPWPSKVFNVSANDPRNPGQKLDFTVRIQEAAALDLRILEAFCKAKGANDDQVLAAITALQIFLRVVPGRRYLQQGAGGNRFFEIDPQTRINLPQGAELARGFFQSMRATMNGLAVNLDTAFTAFLKGGNGVDVVFAMLGIGGARGGPAGRGGRGGFQGGQPGRPQVDPAIRLRERDIIHLRNKLKGASFRVSHGKMPGRIYKISGIEFKGAAERMFEPNKREEGKVDETTISVLDFFQQEHNIALRYPNLPLISYGRACAMPLELAEILPNHPIQPFSLTAEQTSSIILESAKPPPERRAGIEHWRRTLDQSNQPGVKAWGLEIAPDMPTVDARVLPPPTVTYGVGRGNRPSTVPPNFSASGAWNLRDVRFTKSGATLSSWTVIVLDGSKTQQDIQMFVSALVSSMKQYGLNVELEQPPIFKPDPSAMSLKQALLDAGKRANASAKGGVKIPQLFLICLPDKDKVRYENIKRHAAYAHIIKRPAKHMSNERGLPQYCANVAMKICIKLGGATQTVQRSDLPGFDDSTIIFGADVRRPPDRVPREQETNPSVASVIASQDGTQSTYKAEVRLQPGRQEVIQDLKAMVIALLKNFYKKAGKKPSKIIFFRDGVSEGQFKMVVEQEARQIRAACSSLEATWQPKLTLVVCGKRHHIRLFADDQRDMDRTGNLPPGTVVDTGVVHPFAFDFYLQSHAGLKGTAKPTHYTVLIDENGYSADDFQRMVHSLCFTYQRATRSVSLVPPAYYADICCTATRALVFDNDSATSVASGSDGQREIQRRLEAFDPLLIQKRLDQNPAFGGAAWYM